MYTPSSFKISDLELISDLIRDHPLGLLISHTNTGISTTPIPFIYKNRGGVNSLIAHIAKANPHWQSLQLDGECVVIFTGNHNYITPSWYPSKETTHQVVPTWNYEIVEVRGQAIIHENIEWLLEQVTELTNTMEKNRSNPWKVSDAPSDYISSHLKGTVGIEIKISEINGKWKMSQNKPNEVSGVVKGLSDPNDPHNNINVANSVTKFLK